VSVTQPRKPLAGRPRVNPLIGTGDDPRREILEAAGRLFTVAGFSATGTRQIAEAVGLRQASLFHYFERKEDVLAALLDQTVEPSLRFATELAGSDAPADVAIYLLIVNDLANYCSGPGNLGSLQVQPEARRERFRDFWLKRDRLRDIYRSFIARGCAANLFIVPDLDLATSIIFGLVESTATWFDQADAWGPSTVFDVVAEFALRALTGEASTVAATRQAAVQFHNEWRSKDAESK
jgi:AcrR family transcriptional regulator